jgi:hypothetical protein
MRQLAFWLATVPLLVASALGFADQPLDEQSSSIGDPRRFMHGIGTANGAGDDVQLFFSRSSLSPDAKDSPAPWSHDIYIAPWNPASGELGTSRVFIGKPEAQEPVSVAQNAGGHIMLTLEDGWKARHGVTQRYGIYNQNLEPIHPYPAEVEPGGHSGHVAAVGDLFVVVYSDGWVDFGGQDNLGSGKGVYAKIYDEAGTELHDADIVHAKRAWWPVVAGGKTNALVAWQQLDARGKAASLEVALIDPVSGSVGPTTVLHDDVQYYTYSARWLAALERFLVVGTADGYGFARLIDSSGRITAALSCLPASVREAGIAVQDKSLPKGVTYAYTPAASGELMQLRAKPDSLEWSGLLAAHDGKAVSWHPVGSLGLFASNGELHWFSLTPRGLEQIRFDPARVAAPQEASSKSCSK